MGQGISGLDTSGGKCCRSSPSVADVEKDPNKRFFYEKAGAECSACPAHLYQDCSKYNKDGETWFNCGETGCVGGSGCEAICCNEKATPGGANGGEGGEGQTTEKPATEQPAKKSNLPMIIGIVVGVVLLLIGIVVIVAVVRKRKSQSLATAFPQTLTDFQQYGGRALKRMMKDFSK